MPPDFSSSEYWSGRFGHETKFEWLATNERVIPVVLGVVGQVLEARGSTSGVDAIGMESEELRTGLRVLHFGCGTSTLGEELYAALSGDDAAGGGSQALVVDGDYVAASLAQRTNHPVPLIQLDVLTLSSLLDSTKQYAPGGWDILLDKSTADAISCGPNLTIGSEEVEPMEVLCENLARVTKKGGKWVCVSYSSRRFDHLRPLGATKGVGSSTGTEGEAGSSIPESSDTGTWSLLRTHTIVRDEMTRREIPDGKGFRTVYEPETPVWVYVLERV